MKIKIPKKILIPAIAIFLIAIGLILWLWWKKFVEWYRLYVIFPRACLYDVPVRYKHLIYEICALKEYGVTLEDIEVKTYVPKTGVCRMEIYIKGKLVVSGDMDYWGHGFIIRCADIYKALK